jgi:hypothetical protein
MAKAPIVGNLMTTLSSIYALNGATQGKSDLTNSPSRTQCKAAAVFP